MLGTMLAASAAKAAPINLQAVRGSPDQPTVAFEVFEQIDGTLESKGPSAGANRFLLDTGASGVFVGGSNPLFPQFSGSAHDQLAANGVNMETGTVQELGVAGTTTVNVSEPVTVYGTSNSSGRSVQLNDVRMISKGNQPNFGGYNGILGTPAMVNRTTSLDLRQTRSNFTMGVDFQSGGPPAVADDSRRFEVSTHMRSFGYDNTPAPTSGPVPFIPNVTGKHQGNQTSGSFLFDTGAQLSIISTQFATDLGLDTDSDGEFIDEVEDPTTDTITVGGVGGSVTAPILGFETLGLESDGGQTINWKDNEVAILDIGEGIDGVFGANYVSGGWSPGLVGAASSGPVQQMHFDFRDTSDSSLVFDLREAAIPEPSSALLLFVGAPLLLRRRRRHV